MTVAPHQPKPAPLDDLAAAEVWLFDLDNTLYPAASRLFDQVDWNMTRFVAEHLQLDPVEARKIQKHYFRTYGTTMRGLMTEHGVDPVVFMDYVHNIDLSPLTPDPALAEALQRLGGRKIIFTNGSTAHARNITGHLGIEQHFEGFFDIIDAAFTPKPATATYAAVCARFGIDPARTVMVEDMAKNLLPAASLGMTTVWVDTGADWSRESAEFGHIHHRTTDLSGWLTALLGG